MAGQWILWFEEFGREDTKRVGSKCANIGEMARIGIPVPPGFAVTTETYDEFLAKTGAGRRIEQYLIRFPEGPQTLADQEEASQTIAAIILTTEMPKDLEDAVSQAYDELCRKCQISDVAVAVRSSGVAEDLPTASFAGQYETYLNVRGKDDLLEKIKKMLGQLVYHAGDILSHTKQAISFGWLDKRCCAENGERSLCRRRLYYPPHNWR